MIETKHVEELVRQTWDARNQGSLTGDVYDLIRALHVAIWQDLTEHPQLQYNPEHDQRVKWMRAIIQAKDMRPCSIPRADSVLEELMEWLMDGKSPAISGKALAAGEKPED